MSALPLFLMAAGLMANKAVFCEKPIAFDVALVDELYLLAKEKNLPLLCGMLY